MIFFGCLIGIITTAMCLRILMPIAERIHLVDLPGGRKQHESVKPLVGGIAIFIGFACAMLSLPISLIGYRPFALGGLLLIFMGILDDMHEVSPHARFGAEIVSALIMTVWASIVITNLGDLFFAGEIRLGFFSIPFTTFAIVGLINAVNMLDGSDGLAGSLIFVQLFLLALTAFLAHLIVEAKVIVSLMGALLGFLYFNFPFSKKRTARVFMGDAGSMFLGYALSWFATGLSQAPRSAIYPVGILWILSITIWDAFRVILLRLFSKKSPFSSDRNHLHHVLQDRGFSPKNICFIIAGSNLMFGLGGVLALHLGVSSPVLFISYFFGFLIYCTGMRFLQTAR